MFGNVGNNPQPHRTPQRGQAISEHFLHSVGEVTSALRNISGGFGILVNYTPHGLVIGLDQDAIRLPRGFFAQITGSAAISGSNSYQWAYGFKEVTWDIVDGSISFTDVDGGRTGSESNSDEYAINLRELKHPTTGIVWGVDTDHADYPTNYDARPVGGGGTGGTHQQDVIVWMNAFQGNNRIVYWFEAMGSHDGACD